MDTLRVLAEANGFFGRTDALTSGHDDHSIARAIGTKLWVRLRPGAYTFPDLWPADVAERHRVIGRAVAGKLGTKVARSHTTAALEHGLLVWDAELSRVHVTRLDGGSGRTESGVEHHEGLTLPSDLVDGLGGPLVKPARAAIETASLVSTEAGLVALDSALHLGRCSRDELDAAYDLMKTWPGMQRTQVAIRLADSRAESVGESRTRYLCYAHNLPAPELQYDVYDEAGRLIGTTDFAWPEHRLFGEFDGKIKYLRFVRPNDSPATSSSARKSGRTGCASSSDGGWCASSGPTCTAEPRRPPGSETFSSASTETAACRRAFVAAHGKLLLPLERKPGEATAILHPLVNPGLSRAEARSWRGPRPR